MVRVPWRRRSGGAGDGDDGDDRDNRDDRGDPSSETTEQALSALIEEYGDEEPVVTCRFQDGTLTVYEEMVRIERASGSRFSEKWIPMNQISGVSYAERLVIHYIQIEQRDFDASEPGLFSSPVDENTLHFGHGKRECARQARDAVLERASG